MKNWPYHPVIYEINTRVWLHGLKEIKNDDKEPIEANHKVFHSPVDSFLPDLLALVRAGQDATAEFNLARPGFRRQGCPE